MDYLHEQADKPWYNYNLTLSLLMDSSFWLDTINLGYSIVNIQERQVIIFKTMYCIFLSEDIFIFTNGADPDEMQH